MAKYAKDIVKGDVIMLDCGYGPQENWKPCKVLSINKYIPLFENDRDEDYIFFYVDDKRSRFETIGFPPFYSLELF